MNKLNLKISELKYKLLTIDELIINLDRLTRFKLPEESFFRVFSSVILKCLLQPSLSKNDIEKLPAEVISQIVCEIWNKSVISLFNLPSGYGEDFNILSFLANYSFCNIDEFTTKLINTPLFVKPVLSSLVFENVSSNLKFLIKSANLTSETEITECRQINALKFPIRKLVIVEGITEEILLPVFAKKVGYDFDKLGIYISGAGGKSKSPSLYFKLKNNLKIPVALLFDNDAKEIAEVLKNSLLPKDEVFVIQEGEFEDIISLNLIKRTLNKVYEPASFVNLAELRESKRMTDNIAAFYRTRHLGEFKKSAFSKIIAENIKYNTDISNEINELIFKLVKDLV